MRTEDQVALRDALSVAPLDLVRHELMSPIAIMSGVVEIFHSRFAELSDAQRDDLLAALRRQLTLLTAVVGRLNSLGDIEHQEFVLDLRPLDVAPVVRALVADLRRLDHTAPLINVHVTGTTVAMADITAMQEILLNLLINALRHGGEEAIDVSVAARNGTIEVEVRDRGAGVPASVRDRIFDPYVRGDDHGPGLGIGLALGRGLAEAQGGALHLRPAPIGTGSVFVLSVPSAEPG